MNQQDDIMPLDNNNAFIIVPFAIDDSKKTYGFVHELLCTGRWHMAETKNKFLYRYITQKLFCDQNKNKKCFVLNYDKKQAGEQKDSLVDLYDEIEIMPSGTLGGLDCETYNFIIDEVRLIVFTSNIGMIAFNLHFLCAQPDCEIISNSLYFMKKSLIRCFIMLIQKLAGRGYLLQNHLLVFPLNIKNILQSIFVFIRKKSMPEPIFLFLLVKQRVMKESWNMNYTI